MSRDAFNPNPSSTTSDFGEKISDVRDSAAGIASKVKDKAAEVGGRVAQTIAGGVESTKSYIRDHDIKDVGDSAVGLIKKYPVHSLLSAIAIGFLIGRTARR